MPCPSVYLSIRLSISVCLSACMCLFIWTIIQKVCSFQTCPQLDDYYAVWKCCLLIISVHQCASDYSLSKISDQKVNTVSGRDSQIDNLFKRFSFSRMLLIILYVLIVYTWGYIYTITHTCVCIYRHILYIHIIYTYVYAGWWWWRWWCWAI